MSKNVSSNRLLELIQGLNFNPTEVMRLFLKSTEEASNGGVVYFDATNPVILAMEAGILTSAAAQQEIQTITRRLYPSTVDNWKDLALHMQDIDNRDIYAQPAGCKVFFLFAVEEIKRKAIKFENSDVKLLTIPKYTNITVGEYDLMVKYPFTIRINKYGNISVKYDISEEGLFGRIGSPLINFEFIKIDNVDYMRIPVECVQCHLHSYSATVSPTTGFKNRYVYKDKFHKIKAYIYRNNKWREIETTQRLTVLNKNSVTLQYQAGNGTVEVSIPPFYFNNNLMGDRIRIDIFTTKGKVSHPLVNYNDGAYKFSYPDLDNRINEHVSVLSKLNTFKVFSNDIIAGGRDEHNFDAIKARVINRSSISEGLAITEKELTNRLNDLGFNLSKVRDNVTERLYAASRLPPNPENSLTTTGVGFSVNTLHTTFEKLAEVSTVANNGNRITVKPNTLYNLENGIMSIVPAERVTIMKDPTLTSLESLVSWVNSNNFVFSPYYYVHDINRGQYDVRAYRLDDPTVLSKVSINENPTLQLDASIAVFQVNIKDNAYELFVGLTVGSNFIELDPANISLQARFSDKEENSTHFLNAELVTPIDPNTGKPVDNQYVYKFVIDTNWDIDEDHRLLMAGTNIPIPLLTFLDIFIVIRDYEPDGFSRTQMDNLIDHRSLPNFNGQTTQYVLSQERLELQLGKHMEHLWKRARTTIGLEDYKVHEVDIPLLYEEDVFEYDQHGIIVLEPDRASGNLIPKIKHQKGDNVLDPKTQQPLLKFRAGEPVIENGQKVLKNGRRGLNRQVDIIVMEGLYYMTSHEETINYIDNVLDTIDEWVFDILGDKVKPELLERTNIMFHPRTTIGDMWVYVENGVRVKVKSNQDLSLRLHVTSDIYNNLEIRYKLEQISKQVIQDILQQRKTISKAEILRVLLENLGTGIQGIELKGFMDNKYDVVTIADELDTPTIGKRLNINSKLEVIVEDSVEFEFVKHSA